MPAGPHRWIRLWCDFLLGFFPVKLELALTWNLYHWNRLSHLSSGFILEVLIYDSRSLTVGFVVRWSYPSVLFRNSSFSCFYCLVIFAKVTLKMILCGIHTECAVGQKLLCMGLLVLTALTVRCEEEKMPLEDPFRLGGRLTDMAVSLRLHVDSVVGAHITAKCLRVRKKTLFWVFHDNNF